MGQRASMLHKLRIEYPGALYHLASRGDRRDDVFPDDVDRQDFLVDDQSLCLSGNRDVHWAVNRTGKRQNSPFDTFPDLSHHRKIMTATSKQPALIRAASNLKTTYHRLVSRQVEPGAFGCGRKYQEQCVAFAVAAGLAGLLLGCMSGRSAEQSPARENPPAPLAAAAGSRADGPQTGEGTNQPGTIETIRAAVWEARRRFRASVEGAPPLPQTAHEWRQHHNPSAPCDLTGELGAQWEMMASANRDGDTAGDDGKRQLSVDCYQRGAAVGRKLLQTAPTSVRTHQELMDGLGNLGLTLLDLDDAKGARLAFQEGLESCYRWAQLVPTNHSAWWELLLTCSRLGDVEILVGDLKAARVSYQQGLKIGRQLSEFHTNDVLINRDWFIMIQKLGEVERLEGNLKAAQDSYQQALDLRLRRSQAAPKDLTALHDVEVC